MDCRCRKSFPTNISLARTTFPRLSKPLFCSLGNTSNFVLYVLQGGIGCWRTFFAEEWGNQRVVQSVAESLSANSIYGCIWETSIVVRRILLFVRCAERLWRTKAVYEFICINDIKTTRSVEQRPSSRTSRAKPTSGIRKTSTNDGSWITSDWITLR